MVDTLGLEPITHACKARVLPVKLLAQKIAGNLFHGPAQDLFGSGQLYILPLRNLYGDPEIP